MARKGDERFLLDDLVLTLPSAMLTGPLRAALAGGFYERCERRLTHTLLRADDRVLDLGAGAGAVSMVAARIVGPTGVVALEANPAMQPVLRRNLRINGFSGVRVIGAAVMGRDHPGPTMTLHVTQAFWAASFRRHPTVPTTAVTVPVKSFPALVRTHGATVAILDVEGAERGILAGPIPDSLRLVIVETHPAVYGPEGLAELAAALAAKGFNSSDEVSGQTVLAFHRTP